jgi:predicted metal-binding protein
MEFEVKIDLKQISKEDLMTCYKLEEVHGYCQACSNYEKNYSCPNFDFTTETYLGAYEYVVLIRTIVSSKLLKEDADKLTDYDFSSRVYRNHLKDYPDRQVTWNDKVSMYFFNKVKDLMTSRLLELESEYTDSLCLVPGNCMTCQVCTKQKGQPCLYPDQLRYSLEALGFLVSDIYEQFFKHTLEWSGDDLPQSFETCSGILSKNKLEISALADKMKNIRIVI